jgi:hypothetical protein
LRIRLKYGLEARSSNESIAMTNLKFQ